MIQTHQNIARKWMAKVLAVVALGTVGWLSLAEKAVADNVIPLRGAIIAADLEVPVVCGDERKFEIVGTFALLRNLRRVEDDNGRVLGYKFDYQFHPLLGEGCHPGLARHVGRGVYKWHIAPNRVYVFKDMGHALGSWKCLENGEEQQRGNLYGFGACHPPTAEQVAP